MEWTKLPPVEGSVAYVEQERAARKGEEREGQMSDRPKPGTAERIHAGTTVEAWLFDRDVPAMRCSWPTAALVERLLEGEHEGETYHYAVRTVLSAYYDLVAHPAGTETFVDRLRALRRAERAARKGEGRE